MKEYKAVVIFKSGRRKIINGKTLAHKIFKTESDALAAIEKHKKFNIAPMKAGSLIVGIENSDKDGDFIISEYKVYSRDVTEWEEI